ncbi:MAG: hypothetical protein SGARI_000905 [Bacillariaceae sp.]
MEAREVTKEELQNNFPTKEVLEQWNNGEDVEWPPMAANVEPEFPELRFSLDWAKGTVIKLWYSEANWPQGSYAPYKVKLDDGREIFAPGDMDQVIRAAPAAE